MYHLAKLGALRSASGGAAAATPPVFERVGDIAFGPSNPDVTFPDDVFTDEIALLLVFSVNTSSASGFTEIGNISGAGGKLYIFWKRCSGSEGATDVTVTSSHFTYGQIVMFSGCITSGTPYEDFEIDTDTSTTASAPNLTTTNSGRLGVAGYTGTAMTGTSPASGWTEQLGDANVFLLDTKDILTATTETGIDRSISSSEWFAYSLALLPAA